MAEQLTHELGCTVILPQDFCLGQERSGSAHFAEVFRLCIEGVDVCDLVVAVFDGADVDAGTAFEVGYAYARGRPVIGVRTDFRPQQERGTNLMLSRSCLALVECPALGEDLAKMVASSGETRTVLWAFAPPFALTLLCRLRGYRLGAQMGLALAGSQVLSAVALEVEEEGGRCCPAGKGLGECCEQGVVDLGAIGWGDVLQQSLGLVRGEGDGDVASGGDGVVAIREVEWQAGYVVLGEGQPVIELIE